MIFTTRRVIGLSQQQLYIITPTPSEFDDFGRYLQIADHGLQSP